MTAKFLNHLQTELVDQQAAQGRGTWRLLSPLLYQTDIDCVPIANPIDIPAGFVTDYASVPRIPFIFDFVGSIASEAAVVHDYLYAEQKTGRKTADLVLKEAALACGCTEWQAWTLYVGVRIGGWYYWNKKQNK